MPTSNIMVDLETLSTKPDAVILAIGAVKFNQHTILDSFYRVINLDSCVKAGLRIDSDTLLWWMRQGQEARDAVFACPVMVYLEHALRDFAIFCGTKDEYFIWGNGSDFDNVILRNAYEAVGQPLPWKFWNNRCFRTARAISGQTPNRRIGTHHNALDDAQTQAQFLLNWWGSKRGIGIG